MVQSGGMVEIPVETAVSRGGLGGYRGPATDEPATGAGTPTQSAGSAR
jgi:hypothetical protein